MYNDRYVVEEKQVGDLTVKVYRTKDTELFLYEIINVAGSVVLLVEGFSDPAHCLREGMDLAQYEVSYKHAKV